jgi:hypothetical protein
MEAFHYLTWLSKNTVSVETIYSVNEMLMIECGVRIGRGTEALEEHCSGMEPGPPQLEAGH